MAANHNLDKEALASAAKAVADAGYGSDDIYNNADELAEAACGAYMDDLVRQLADLSPCEDCNEEDQMATQTEQKRHTPDYQTGENVIVLGAREGNIGGSIAQRLAQAGFIAQEDDCYRPDRSDIPEYAAPENFFNPYYLPPKTKSLEPYNACVITLGATHMEPFSEVSRLDFRGVIYGSLELPLECARRYVRARKQSTLPDGHNSDEPLGTIIFIGSYAHDHPFTHCTSYCTAKAGLDMAARCLAWELMPEGFRVHIIHPHHVQGTPMTDEVLAGMKAGVHKMTDEEAEKYQRKDLRMPDLLKPEEIAEMVLALLTVPTMQWTSGTSIKMYGGVR